MADDLSQQIADATAKPVSMSADGQQVTMPAIRDQIEADRYLKSAAATSKPRRLLNIFKINPGGPG
jgi:hypothetical protein